VCTTGFTGSNCQHRVNPCDSSPCLNDGRCTERSRTAFDCSCQPGFTGRRCESFVDWCSGAAGPCRNGATCVQRSSQYQCLCPAGWDGPSCDVPSVSCTAVAASRGIDTMVDTLCVLPGNCLHDPVRSSFIRECTHL